MTERKPHPDNDLIESMDEEAGGATSQNDRFGGNIARDIGTRAEQKSSEGGLTGNEVDRVRGSDHPGQDELKGEKTIGAMPTTPD